MAEQTLTMHRTFLSEIRQRRQAIEEELQRLETVEQYHLDRISQLSAPSPQSVGVAESPVATTPVDVPVDGLTKHDACELALRQLGGRQKTVQVAEWLLTRGYGNRMEKRVFYNACYTAMNRKKGVFKKIKGGQWELIEKPSNP